MVAQPNGMELLHNALEDTQQMIYTLEADLAVREATLMEQLGRGRALMARLVARRDELRARIQQHGGV